MPLPDVTVLLPTRQRPGMFRIALQSIQAQTARLRIREVIVSENGPPAGAAAICDEFRASLPVKYVLRDPELPPLEHERVLLREAQASPYVAILHDDDVWSPEHLERALVLLEKHETVVLYCSAFRAIRHDGELAPDDSYQYDAMGMFWFGSGYQPGTQEWVLGPDAVIMSCLPGTPQHYSSMVMRSRYLPGCDYIYDFDNNYDRDRLLLLALGRQGPLVYNPLPGVFIRIHAQQGLNEFSLAERLRLVDRTTTRALEYARERNFDFLTALHRGMDDCPSESFQRMAQIFDRPCVRAALRRATRRQRGADPAGLGRGKVLFISPNAAEADTSRFLLHLLQWLRRETDQEFELFLGTGGPLEAEFSKVARIHSFAGLAKKPDYLRWSFFQQFDLIYSNGCGGGALLERLPCEDIPIVTHLHELDAGIDSFGAKPVAQLIRHTDHYVVGSAAMAECWRRRFRVPAARIRLHEAIGTALGETIAEFVRQPPPPSVHRAAGHGLCDVFETWPLEEAPDRAFVLAKLARHRARLRAQALVADGMASEAIQTLIRAIRTDNESRDPHRILEGLIEIGQDLAPLDGAKARFLGAEADKLARSIAVDLGSLRAYLAREGRQPVPESSPGDAVPAAAQPELVGQGV